MQAERGSIVMKHKKVLGSTGLLLFYLGVFLVFIAPVIRLLQAADWLWQQLIPI